MRPWPPRGVRTHQCNRLDPFLRRRPALELTEKVWHDIAEHRCLRLVVVGPILALSRSAYAKMEAAHRTVSTDLLLKSLFRLGASPHDVARLFTRGPRGRVA